jgi:hypothetical protein
MRIRLGVGALLVIVPGCSLFVDLDDGLRSTTADSGDMQDASPLETGTEASSVQDASTPDSSLQDSGSPDVDLRTDAGDPNTRYIFVTSRAYPANFGSTGPAALISADVLCKADAEAATQAAYDVLKGRQWKAWLSSRAVAAISRIDSAPTLVWKRVDGAVIFPNTDAILSQSLSTRISISNAGTRVWTGTNAANGSANGDTCAEWTSTSTSPPPQEAIFGLANATDGQWSGSAKAACNNSYPIYCFETRP